MSRDVVPQAIGTVESIHPVNMRVHWDVFGPNPDDIVSISVAAHEKDSAGEKVQSQDISVDVADLPAAIITELNRIVNFMLDEYITEHGYVSAP